MGLSDARFQVARHVIEVDGLSVSYLEAGEPRAEEPTIVLVHGLMGTGATFAPLIESLWERRHVVAIDLPGAGESQRAKRLDPSLHASAESVLGVLDALGLERPVLAGHSHGGAVAMYLAARYPLRLSGIVLLAPAHPYFRHADQVIAFYLSPLGAMFAHTLPWYPEWVQMAGLRRMAGPQSWDDISRLAPYRSNLRTRGTIGHLLRLLKLWHRDMAELKALLECPFRMPTLVIWGDHDRAVPVETAEDLCKRLPWSELVVLEGVGHRPAEERAGACTEAIDQWLERLKTGKLRLLSASG